MAHCLFPSSAPQNTVFGVGGFYHLPAHANAQSGILLALLLSPELWFLMLGSERLNEFNPEAEWQLHTDKMPVYFSGVDIK